MNGYEEAIKFERQLNAKLRQQPLTKENAQEWWKFTRTVISGLQIIQKEAIELHKEAVDERGNREESN